MTIGVNMSCQLIHVK